MAVRAYRDRCDRDQTVAMPTLSLPDLELYHEVHGTGPQRVLMFNGSGSTIEAAGPLIGTLARHFTVLIHDQRGLGRTGPPATQPSMADYASDAIALLDHVGWQTCRVFGISFGGMVAQEFAVTVPDRVERMALLCTSAGGGGGASFPLHTLADMAADERAAVALRNLDTRFDADWLASHPSDKAIADLMAARATIAKTDQQRLGEQMQLMARADHDVWDRLADVTCQTLVACGDFDGLAPPANSAAIAERIPAAELRTYQGGHLFAYQDPAALPEIVAFLAA
jgi:3-oxoadipate enol-lactonase